MSTLANIVKVLIIVWALISVGVGVFAFAVVSGYGDLGAAVREGFETIPEAILHWIGVQRPPAIATIAYWIALITAVALCYRKK